MAKKKKVTIMKLLLRLRLKPKQGGKQKQKHRLKPHKRLSATRRKKNKIRSAKMRKSNALRKRRKREEIASKLNRARCKRNRLSKWNSGANRRKRLKDNSFLKTAKTKTNKTIVRKKMISQRSVREVSKLKATTMELWSRKQRNLWPMMMKNSQLPHKAMMLVQKSRWDVLVRRREVLLQLARKRHKKLTQRKLEVLHLIQLIQDQWDKEVSMRTILNS